MADHLRHASEAALAHNGGRDDRIDFVFRVVLRFFQDVDDVEYQRLVGDGTEWAFIDASPARDALLVVNSGLVVLVHRNGLHLAAHHAGTMLEDNGRIGARLRAFATFDAFFLIHRGFVIHDGDGVFWTNLLAAVNHTSAAGGCHVNTVDGALVARTVDDLYHVGVLLVAAHCQLNTVLQNGALLVDTAAGLCFGSGTEELGNLHVSILETTLVGTADDLLQDLVFN